MNGKIKTALKLGAYVTVAVLLVNFILATVLSMQVSELFGVTPATGITTTLGSKVIATMQKLVSFDVLAIIYLYISAVIIVFVGSWLITALKLPTGKGNWQKTALMLLYGTIPFYALLVGIGLPAIGTIVGLVAYYIGVALVLGILQGLKVKLT